MKTTAWGAQGLTATRQGLGAMGMSAWYGQLDDTESAATLHRALDLGITLVDTAEVYGPWRNEQLIGATLGSRRDEYSIATKFGTHIADNGERGPVDGSPEYARIAVERSLRHLQTDVIDLYYLHRVDPNVPVEESIGAMAEFVREGKVRFLGISEAAPDTIRRAHATHPLTAVQTEYSLFERTPEINGVLDTTRELGITFVAYSPLGRGVLGGRIRSADDLDTDDFRRHNPRFAQDNLRENVAVVDKLRDIAGSMGATPGQLAIAWVMAQEGVVTIPGTKRRSYLEENVAADDIVLSAGDLAALEVAAPVGVAAGDRYDTVSARAVHL